MLVIQVEFRIVRLKSNKSARRIQQVEAARGSDHRKQLEVEALTRLF
jgi:hypothetical protein